MTQKISFYSSVFLVLGLLIASKSKCKAQDEAEQSGQCTCNSDELDQLNTRIQNLQDELESIKRTAATLEETRVSCCNVGMEDGRILDSQITASSSHSGSFGPRHGRLNNQPTEGNHGCWIAGPRPKAKPGEYIQIALQMPTRVTAVVTQGRPTTRSQYTTSYNVAYGNSTDSMQTIKDSSGNDKVFQGNINANSEVTNTFSQPVTASYFRLIVQTWHSYPAIRMELLTC